MRGQAENLAWQFRLGFSDGSSGLEMVDLILSCRVGFTAGVLLAINGESSE